MNAYKEGLAYIHEIGFGDFARQAAPGLLKIFQKNKITNEIAVLRRGYGYRRMF